MRVSTPLNRIYRLNLSFKAILISVILGRKDLPSRGYKTLFSTQIMQERNQVCDAMRINTMLLHSKNDVIAVQSQ